MDLARRTKQPNLPKICPYEYNAHDTQVCLNKCTHRSKLACSSCSRSDVVPALPDTSLSCSAIFSSTALLKAVLYLVCRHVYMVTNCSLYGEIMNRMTANIESTYQGSSSVRVMRKRIIGCSIKM